MLNGHCSPRDPRQRAQYHASTSLSTRDGSTASMRPLRPPWTACKRAWGEGPSRLIFCVPYPGRALDPPGRPSSLFVSRLLEGASSGTGSGAILALKIMLSSRLKLALRRALVRVEGTQLLFYSLLEHQTYFMTKSLLSTAIHVTQDLARRSWARIQ